VLKGGRPLRLTTSKVDESGDFPNLETFKGWNLKHAHRMVLGGKCPVEFLCRARVGYRAVQQTDFSVAGQAARLGVVSPLGITTQNLMFRETGVIRRSCSTCSTIGERPASCRRRHETSK
jgi:hypothetical protein